MAVDPRLRADLLNKLDIADRQLRRRAAARRLELPMSSDEAIYTIGAEAELDLSKYLTAEETLQVRRLVSDLRRGSNTEGPVAPSTTARRGRQATKPARGAEFALDKVRVPAGVLSDQHRREAERMAIKVYPLLYAFENSAREFIDGHLTAVYGPDWWDDPKLVHGDPRKTVEISRRAAAANRTHSAGNARPIYYTTFGDLVSIVLSENGAKVFKAPLFPRPTWFPELVKASEHSRNIVAHMNPLKAQDINRLEINFQDWLNQIKGHLPPAV